MKFATRISSIRRDRVEAVQVVLGRLGLDVPGLVRQLGARRMDPLAARLQHLGHRVLGEPVDLQVRGAACAARRRSPRPAARGPGRSARRCTAPGARAPRARVQAEVGRGAVDELAHQQVDPDRIAASGICPEPCSVTNSPPVASASAAPWACGTDQVPIAVDHERRAANPCAGVPEALRPRGMPDPARGVSERLRGRSRAPSRCSPRSACSSAAR